jgi:hypothetical protein
MNSALPGGDLIDEGVRDLREQRETIAALLVAIGSPRLAGWVLNCLNHFRKILSIAPMISWQRMILIPRIRVTML